MAAKPLAISVVKKTTTKLKMTRKRGNNMFESQIAEGTQYLDGVLGEKWVFNTNPPEMYMSAGCSCLLAQVGEEEDFNKTRTLLGLSLNDCARYGFYLWFNEPDELESTTDYVTLTKEWRKHIIYLQEERRKN